MLGATASVLVTLVLFNCVGASRNPSTNYVSAIEVSSTGAMEYGRRAPVSAMQPDAPIAASRPEASISAMEPSAPHAARHPAVPITAMAPVAQELNVLLVQQNAPPHGEVFAHALVNLLDDSEDVHVIVLTLQDLHVAGDDHAKVDVIDAKSRTKLPRGYDGNTSALFEEDSEFSFLNQGLPYRRMYVKIIPQAGVRFSDCGSIAQGAKNQMGPVALALYVRHDVEADFIGDKVVEIARAGKTCKGTMMLKYSFMKNGNKFVVVFGSTHGKDGVDAVAMQQRYNTVEGGAIEATKFANEGEAEENDGAAILWGGDFNSRYVHRLDGELLRNPEVILLNSQRTYIQAAVVTNLSYPLPAEPIAGQSPKAVQSGQPLIMMPIPKLGQSLQAFCQYGKLLNVADYHDKWCGGDRCDCKLEAGKPIHTTAWDTLQVRLAATKGWRGLDALIVSGVDSRIRGVFYDSFVMCDQSQCTPGDQNLPRLEDEPSETTQDVLGIDQGGHLRSHKDALGGGWSMIPSGFRPDDGMCMPEGTDESLCLAPTFKIKSKGPDLKYETGVPRPTSWPDRVMYKSGYRTMVTEMSADSEYFHSDHGSIVGRFSLKVQ